MRGALIIILIAYSPVNLAVAKQYFRMHRALCQYGQAVDEARSISS